MAIELGVADTQPIRSMIEINSEFNQCLKSEGLGNKSIYSKIPNGEFFK